MSKYMLLLLRFFYVFLHFFENPKKRDFLRFLLCFTRFLELCVQLQRSKAQGEGNAKGRPPPSRLN